MKRYPPRRLAFAIVGAVLVATLYGSVFIAGGYALHPMRVFSVPAYCNGVGGVAKCLRENYEISGATVIKLSCDKSGKKGYSCDVELSGAYGPACGVLAVERSREGVPVIVTGAEKEC